MDLDFTNYSYYLRNGLHAFTGEKDDQVSKFIKEQERCVHDHQSGSLDLNSLISMKKIKSFQ